MSVFSNTRAAAFVEYAVLTSLIGVLSIFAVVTLGGSVQDTYAKARGTLSAEGLGQTPNGPATVPLVASQAVDLTTWEGARSQPYAPTYTAVPGRLYVEFVMTTFDNGGTWQHYPEYAADHTPGEVVTAPPYGLSAGPTAAMNAGAYPLCLFASQQLGTVADPAASFFPPVFGGAWSDITLHDVRTVQLTKADHAAAQGVQYWEDATSPSTTRTEAWASEADPLEVIVAFTCSRPF